MIKNIAIVSLSVGILGEAFAKHELEIRPSDIWYEERTGFGIE